MDHEQMVARIEYLHERTVLLEKRMNCIQTIARALGSSLNMDEVLHTVAREVTTMLDAHRATVFLVDEDSGQLRSRVIIGPELKEVVLEKGQGVAGWVAKTGKTLNVKDAYKDKRFDPHFDQVSGFKTESILCQPMVTYRGKIVGVVQALNKTTGYFTLEDEHLLSTITTQATISIENAKYYAEVQEANFQLRDAQDNLKRNYQRLETLYRIQADMSQTWEPDTLMEAVLRQLLTAIPCGVGALLLARPAPARLYVLESGNRDAQVIVPAIVSGIVGAVVEAQNGSIGSTLPSDIPPILHPQVDVDVSNFVCEPLSDGEGEVFGSLVLANRRRSMQFDAEEEQLLRIVARQVALAVERLTQHDELTRSNNLALIGQALSGVLHDLKSPMSVISGYVQLMEAEEEEAKRNEYAMAVLKQFKQVSSMTQEVLAFARGETQILKRNIYLSKFLQEVEELLRQEMAGSGIELSVVNTFKKKLKADEDKLRRVMFNIARNAREAMPAGGSFSILVEEAGDHVRFKFTDTGPGIPEEIRDRLFQSFVTTGKKDGTGLGLAIVKKIVEQHGGDIKYSSAAGQGTTFTILLPKE